MLLPGIVLAKKSFDLNLPAEVQAAVVGLLFGIIAGLFYYQSYRKIYYWWISLGSGVLSGVLTYRVLKAMPGVDEAAMESVLVQFIVPGLVCFAVNHIIYKRKKSYEKKRRQRHKRHHSMKAQNSSAETLFSSTDTPKP